MTTLENINIKFTADLSGLTSALSEVKKLTDDVPKSEPGKPQESASTLGSSFSLAEIQKLANDDILADVVRNKVFSGDGSLNEFDKQVLQSLDGLKSILEADLQKILDLERERLVGAGVGDDEIEARLDAVKEGGNKVIDDLFDDFTDTLDEAVKDLSKKVADAFVDMALKGEFSIKTIGDIFLKTFLDIIAKELIQKPLEDLLGSVVDIGLKVIGGSATGGDIAAGVPTFINEQGQEIFIPHAPGRIVDADQARRMLGGGQGVVVNQNLSFDTAIKNDMVGIILQASPLLVEHTKIAVLESLQGRRI